MNFPVRRWPNTLSLVILLVAGMLGRAQAQSEYAVEIDLQEQRAFLLRHGRMILESPVSTGRANYRTPSGSFQVIARDMDHHSSLYGKIVNASG